MVRRRAAARGEERGPAGKEAKAAREQGLVEHHIRSKWEAIEGRSRPR